jgi:hypothetical protein
MKPNPQAADFQVSYPRIERVKKADVSTTTRFSNRCAISISVITEYVLI